MPDCILDILCVDGLMNLELFTAFLVSLRIVVGDATLPVMRFTLRIETDKLIKIGNRFFDPSIEKPLFTPTFEGLAATFDVIWYPLLVGCLICGLSAGAMGYVLVRWMWRLHLVWLRARRAKNTSAKD